MVKRWRGHPTGRGGGERGESRKAESRSIPPLSQGETYW